MRSLAVIVGFVDPFFFLFFFLFFFRGALSNMPKAISFARPASLRLEIFGLNRFRYAGVKSTCNILPNDFVQFLLFFHLLLFACNLSWTMD